MKIFFLIISKAGFKSVKKINKIFFLDIFFWTNTIKSKNKKNFFDKIILLSNYFEILALERKNKLQLKFYSKSNPF